MRFADHRDLDAEALGKCGRQVEASEDGDPLDLREVLPGVSPRLGLYFARHRRRRVIVSAELNVIRPPGNAQCALFGGIVVQYSERLQSEFRPTSEIDDDFPAHLTGTENHHWVSPPWPLAKHRAGRSPQDGHREHAGNPSEKPGVPGDRGERPHHEPRQEP